MSGISNNGLLEANQRQEGMAVANSPGGSGTRMGFLGFKAVFAARAPLKGPENNNALISVNIPEKKQGKRPSYWEWIQPNGLNTQQKEGEL